MTESRNNANLYKYILAAVIAIFTIYVSFTQGSSRIDDRIENRVQQAITNYTVRSESQYIEIEKRLGRIDDKLERLQERSNRER